MPGVFLGHVGDGVSAVALRYGALRRAERGSREQLLAIQTGGLERLLAYTTQHSPFYRARWGGVAPRATDLQQLEPLTRTALVEHTDRILTDRSLNRKTLYGWLGKPGRRPYVVAATSGTTGQPVVVPFSRRAWRMGLAYFLRGGTRFARNPLDAMWTARRAAGIATRNPHHLSTQLAQPATMNPFHLQLAAGTALDELVERLQRFQPTILSGYPSVLDLLAKAQLAGELRIAPRAVLTGGETLPTGFRDTARAAWKAEVFDVYGLTEAHVFAYECGAHAGLHIDEDAVILEVVDEQHRVLPPGEQGDAVLVTGLVNETLPIIRYRVDDVLRITETPCACGLPFARIVSVEGRQEEWVVLGTSAGATVKLRPSVVEEPLQTNPDVQRFQLRNRDGACHVLVVPHRPVTGLDATIRSALVAALAKHAVPEDAVKVTLVETIDQERGRTDKRQRVIHE